MYMRHIKRSYCPQNARTLPSHLVTFFIYLSKSIPGLIKLVQWNFYIFEAFSRILLITFLIWPQTPEVKIATIERKEAKEEKREMVIINKLKQLKGGTMLLKTCNLPVLLPKVNCSLIVKYTYSILFLTLCCQKI